MIKKVYIPENSIDSLKFFDTKYIINKKINLIWIGSIVERKSLIILLKVLSKTKNNTDFLLNVIGDGPLKKSLQEYAKKMAFQKLLIGEEMFHEMK